MNNLIISIDGPAGSGKERIAKYLKKKYKLFHLDSGIIYRRLAFMVLKKKKNFKNELDILKLIKSIDTISSRSHKILRNQSVANLSSKIAILPFVRNFVNSQQKIIIKNKLKSYKGCVIDGRDIGSKVFKNANIKLFIRVNAEIRAKRRHKQLIELGEKSIYAQILKEINLRDKTDKNRSVSPLVMPDRAIVIDNSFSFKNTISQINEALKNITK